MPRIPQLWFRTQRRTWCVQIKGKRYYLGRDEAKAREKFAALMAEHYPGASPDTDPANPPPEDSNILTLRAAYERYHRTSQGHRPRTVEEYRRALTLWEELTGNPDAQTVTNRVMLDFRAGLESYVSAATGRTLGPATVRKTLTEVQAIFATIGPAQYGNPYGLGITPTIPVCRKPEMVEPNVITAAPEELQAIYRACSVAQWPHWGGEPVTWWRCLVVYLWSIGSRRNEFLELKWEDVNLPKRELEISPLKRGKSPVKPIPPQLAEHMLQMVSPTREYWFQCPNSRKSLYGTWQEIQQAAGIIVKRPEGDSRRPVYCFHELRKTAGTVWFSLSPGAAQYMLGHASLATTERHYAAKGRLVREAMAHLPQPFTAGDSAPVQIRDVG